MFISHAQNFEDVILWRALKDIPNGFYIDIGAQDPSIDSVSKAFYDNGWRGIHAEASESYVDRLRAARPGEHVEHAAIGPSVGLIDFYDIECTGLSTADKEIAERHRSDGRETRKVQVRTLPLSELFKMAGGREIHWLKIDVEGMEQSVIQSWEPSSARPWIVVVESTLPNTQISTHESWEPALLSLGYEFVYFDGLNRFYVSSEHAELAQHFGPGPNFFDYFKLSENSVFTLNKDEHILRAINDIAALNERIRRLEETVEKLADGVGQLSLIMSARDQPSKHLNWLLNPLQQLKIYVRNRQKR